MGDRSAWLEASLFISTLRRAGAAVVAWVARQGREGLFGCWWEAVARARTVAPQRTIAAILLSGLGANTALVLGTNTAISAEGLAVRGILMAGALAAVFLEEGKFALWWRTWWLGRLIGFGGRRAGTDLGTVESSSPEKGADLTPSMAAGALLGVFWWLSPGMTFLGLLSTAIAAALRRLGNPTEQKFLARLFIGSFVLRAGIVAIVYLWVIARGRFYPQPSVLDFQLHIPMVFGDGGYLTSRAWALSQVWRGAEVWPHGLYEIAQTYGETSFLYLPAAFFYLFGAEGLIAVRGINVLLGAVLPLLVFAFARDLFTPLAARISAIVAAVFPSLLLWNLDLLKDPLFITLVFTAIWLLVRFQRRKRFGYLLAAAAAAGLSATVRFHFGMLTLGVVGLGLLPFLWRGWVGRSPVRALMVVVLLVAVFVSPSIQGWMGRQLFRTFFFQMGYVDTPAATTYTIWPERLHPYRSKSAEEFLQQVNRRDILRGFALGQYYLWLEPTPRAAKSRAERFAVPHMLLWYALLLWVPYGIWQVRRRPSELFVLVSFILILGAVIGLTGGNLGTIFRHRDVLTPVLIVIAGGGLAGWFIREPPPSNQWGGPT
jgi:4-amino-4-deoxy-L-arabinose transferase-like glycosyltransferase